MFCMVILRPCVKGYAIGSRILDHKDQALSQRQLDKTSKRCILALMSETCNIYPV